MVSHALSTATVRLHLRGGWAVLGVQPRVRRLLPPPKVFAWVASSSARCTRGRVPTGLWLSACCHGHLYGRVNGVGGGWGALQCIVSCVTQRTLCVDAFGHMHAFSLPCVFSPWWPTRPWRLAAAVLCPKRTPVNLVCTRPCVWLPGTCTMRTVHVHAHVLL